MFKNKTLLITGGTGSFGNAVLDKFIDSDIGEIRVFSRDEKKQHDMRTKYSNRKLKFFLGDVRDFESISKATKGVDYIFQAAALKQVPTCEFFPTEAVRTNILGTENVIKAAENNNVKSVICLSTDKAAYPINAMGMSKALMEKVAISNSRNHTNDDLKICVTRYGNVMASRGSVIPLFVDQIKNKQDLTITNPNMTRYLMSLDEAVNLVLFAFKKGNSGDLLVQKSPACTIQTLAEAMIEIFQSKNKIKVIGTRHGEKLYETLCTREEMFKAEDLNEYYRVPVDSRDMNYNNYFSDGSNFVEDISDYNSHNTYRLNKQETIKKLLSLDFIQNELASIQ